MSGVIYSNRVIARNSIGDFIKACEQAAGNTVLDLVTEGAALAGTLAPRRTGALAASIKPFMIARNEGVWGSNAKYAAAQEFGARPHALPANVSFYWEKMSRMWMPPEVYLRVTGYPGNDPINHPGNPATHFLRESARLMAPRVKAVAKSHYPG